MKEILKNLKVVVDRREKALEGNDLSDIEDLNATDTFEHCKNMVEYDLDFII